MPIVKNSARCLPSHWHLMHLLVKNIHDWGPGYFHVKLRRGCGRQKACLCFSHVLFTLISHACMGHFWIVRINWREMLLSVHEIIIYGVFKMVKATKRVVLDRLFSRLRIYIHLSLYLWMLDHIDRGQRWYMLRSLVNDKAIITQLVSLRLRHPIFWRFLHFFNILPKLWLVELSRCRFLMSNRGVSQLGAKLRHSLWMSHLCVHCRSGTA